MTGRAEKRQHLAWSARIGTRIGIRRQGLEQIAGSGWDGGSGAGCEVEARDEKPHAAVVKGKGDRPEQGERVAGATGVAFRPGVQGARSLMSNALWSGASLAALLERAGPLPDAARVVFGAPDGHEESVHLEIARRPENLIAYAINGEQLTRLHGHPARVLLPGLYGFKQVRWLTHVRLTPETHWGYWPRRGWTDEAVIRTTARTDLARVENGQLRAAGMTLAGGRGITSVEARDIGSDGRPGEWVPAALHTPPLSGMTWVQWRWTSPVWSRSRPSGTRADDRKSCWSSSPEPRHLVAEARGA